MVDVSDKRETVREAVARAILRMKPATLRVIRQGNAPKGDVLGVARTAGILAASARGADPLLAAAHRRCRRPFDDRNRALVDARAPSRPASRWNTAAAVALWRGEPWVRRGNREVSRQLGRSGWR
jgi:hypothetical protein